MSVQSSFGTSESPPGLHSEHRSPFPLLQGAAQGWRCHVLGPPRCSGDGDGQSQPQPCSTGPIERLRGGDISPAWMCPPPAAEQGVLGGSCPADSQQLVWCEQRFSDHLLAVGGAGSTPARGLPGGAVPTAGLCPPLQVSDLQDPRRSCRVPEGTQTKGCAAGIALALPCTLAPEEPVRALRAERPPHGTEGRAVGGPRAPGCHGWGFGRFLDTGSPQTRPWGTGLQHG